MKKEIKAPSVGESITEVSILKWAKQDGQSVKAGELLLEIESDKATVELVAESSGILQILKPAGERILIGAVIGTIDDAASPSVGAPPSVTAPSAPPPSMAAAPSIPPVPPTSSAPAAPVTPGFVPPPMGPAATRVATQFGVDTTQIAGTGRDGRVTKGDVLQQMSAPTSVPAPASFTPSAAPSAPTTGTGAVKTTSAGPERRVPMSMLRQRIAERLVQAQHTAAILTTFNEVDLSKVMALRNQHKDAFKIKHGVSLSFMSFFAKASIAALKAIPEVNATIDGKDIIYHDYYDLGIAVGTDRGLVVPVVRNVDTLSFSDIEKKLAELAQKARDGKLSLADMSGGTFTISNGGTYGSMMSTPILNSPQSGILGMHKIMDRPVAIDGKVEIRPMMYLALSYDHRLIDGKGAVTFLVQLKDNLENPEKLGFSL